MHTINFFDVFEERFYRSNESKYIVYMSESTKTTSETTASRTGINSKLLNNSIICLAQYRNLQAKRLRIRLNIFTKVVLDLFKTIDNIKGNGCHAVESQQDIDIINRIIELESFVTFPTYAKDCKSITHFYTVGMWYYWGIPEIILQFNLPITENTDFANVILNIIHDKLFTMYRDKIMTQDINRVDFFSEPKGIKLKLDKFDITFKMHRVSTDQYMEMKAMYMMWFYMYYMDAPRDQNNRPALYPVYRIEIDRTDYEGICRKIMNKLLHSAIENLNNDSVSDDSASDQSDDSTSDDTESTIMNNITSLPTIVEGDEDETLDNTIQKRSETNAHIN